MLKIAGVVLISLVMTKSCSIGFGNPQGTGGSEVTLGVPYIPQEGGSTCGPASVQMWAWYNGYRSVTQEEIGNYIGCNPNTGVSPQSLVLGVQHFANVGDASATAGAASNFSTYGPSTVLRGAGIDLYQQASVADGPSSTFNTYGPSTIVRGGGVRGRV